MPTLRSARRRPEIYGITGRKGHGKDTFARLIVEAAQDFHKASTFTTTHFAKRLKQIAGRVYGLTDQQLHDPACKEAQLPLPIEMGMFVPALRLETGLDIGSHGRIAGSPREVMQFLGTDYVRAADPLYWTRIVGAEIGKKRRFLVPDTRFPNEAAALRLLGGLIVKIVRIDATVSTDEHASETEIDAIEPDILVGVRTADLSLPRKVAQLIALNKYDSACRYDYRRVEPAIRAYLGGMPKEAVVSTILGAKNLYVLDNVLDYYQITQRTQSAKRVQHETLQGVPHKRCLRCRALKAFQDFNASVKAWDGLHAYCRACSAEDHRQRYARYSAVDTLETVFKTTKRFAPSRGLEFSLALADMHRMWAAQNGRCWYSGVPLSTAKCSPNKVTLDRVDSSRGYTCENVVLAAYTVNMMKRDMTVAVFQEWIERVSATLASRMQHRVEAAPPGGENS